jgi:hypothetical protein
MSDSLTRSSPLSPPYSLSQGAGSRQDQRQADRDDCLQEAQQTYGSYFVGTASARRNMRAFDPSPRHATKDDLMDCMRQADLTTGG